MIRLGQMFRVQMCVGRTSRRSIILSLLNSWDWEVLYKRQREWLHERNNIVADSLSPVHRSSCSRQNIHKTPTSGPLRQTDHARQYSTGSNQTAATTTSLQYQVECTTLRSIGKIFSYINYHHHYQEFDNSMNKTSSVFWKSYLKD